MQIPPFIKRLAKFCDKEQSRYALGGIECKSDGTTAQLTATDGRILATVHWPDKDCVEMDVIADGRQLSSPPAKAFKTQLGVRFDGEEFRAGHQGTVEAIDGRFPKYEQLFPDSLDGYVGVRLDADLLRKLCDLSHDMNSDQHGRGITLFVKDATSCVFGTTTSTEGHVARMCIMPRAADSDDWKPDFPARPGAESEDTESPRCAIEVNVRDKTARKIDRPAAPPPETLDDDEIAEAVTREPEPVGCGYDDLPAL